MLILSVLSVLFFFFFLQSQASLPQIQSEFSVVVVMCVSPVRLCEAAGREGAAQVLD